MQQAAQSQAAYARDGAFKEGSNRAIIFALLDRPEGATLEECSAAIRNRSRTLVSLRTDLDEVARITQRPLVRIKDRCYLGDRP
jgi:hypothetical protein